MFGKRKPKPEEDDPLVPHGMVWHATTAPADKVDPIPAVPKESNLMEIVPGSNRLQVRAPGSDTPARKGSLGSCPPLSWEPVKRSEPGDVPPPLVKKKVRPPAEFVPTSRRDSIRPNPIDQGPIRQVSVRAVPLHQDQVRQVPIAKDPIPQNESNGQQIPPTANRMASAATQNVGRISEAVSGGLSRVARGSQQLWSSATSAFLRLRQSDLLRKRALHFARSIDWQEPVRRGGNFLANVKSACTVLARQRVRIRLGGTPLRVKILLTRSISEWKLKRNSMRIDARLWGSMMMAAISALLVLGLISAVRHYATQSLPSRIGSTHSLANSKNEIPADAVPAKVAAQAGVVPAKTASQHAAAQVPKKPAVIQAKQVSTSSPATSSAVRKKPRATTSDDYVAPDTYTYYGNKPQGSK